MKTRRFHSNDIQSALREVRNQLGPDAVILTTQETADGIEVVAGVLPGPLPTPSIVRCLETMGSSVAGARSRYSLPRGCAFLLACSSSLR
jgi:flagellar biosynthesis GTPase FlhF